MRSLSKFLWVNRPGAAMTTGRASLAPSAILTKQEPSMIARRMTALLCSAPLALVAMGLASPALAKSKPVQAEAIDAVLAGGQSAKAMEIAEKAVAASPRDGALRAALGRAYLKEGRFQSAATALTDAVTLGENSSRTLLSLALAQTGAGQSREAAATLDAGRNTIPAVDLGLALALAGETSRGTVVLGDALRAGDQSDKLRANLAYAYALDGRWAEARNLVALDMDAAKVDERMTEWAKAAAPEAARERVASLLGVAMKADGGLPARLALAPAATDAPVLAAADAAAVNAPTLAAAPEAELPAMVEAPVEAAPAPIQFAAVEPVAAEAAPKLEIAHKAGAVKPRVKLVKAKLAKRVKAKAVEEVKPEAEPVLATVEPKVAGGDHLVQLGAFLSEKNASRAKAAALLRDKSLSESDVTVAKAVVGGKTFWRVMVAGLDASGAAGKCQSIRKLGGVCFARSESGLAKPKLAIKKAPKPVAKSMAKTLAIRAHVKVFEFQSE